jgi:hypothetical protein
MPTTTHNQQPNQESKTMKENSIIVMNRLKGQAEIMHDTIDRYIEDGVDDGNPDLIPLRKAQQMYRDIANFAIEAPSFDLNEAIQPILQAIDLALSERTDVQRAALLCELESTVTLMQQRQTQQYEDDILF